MTRKSSQSNTKCRSMPMEEMVRFRIPLQSWRGGTALPSGEGLSRAGYEFAGWSEECDGDLLGESIVVSRDVVLHAKWNDSFSVSYREDYTGEVKSIEIPALYQGKVVDSIPSGGFSGCPMTSVVIPDSIHHIFSNAFHGCSPHFVEASFWSVCLE